MNGYECILVETLTGLGFQISSPVSIFSDKMNVFEHAMLVDTSKNLPKVVGKGIFVQNAI